MRGRRGGKRGGKGGRKPSPAIVEDHNFPNSPPSVHPSAARTRLGANSSLALRKPVRNLNVPADHSSSSTSRNTEMQQQQLSTSMPISNSNAAKETTLSVSPTSANIQSSPYNGPQVDHQEVFGDVECATNFAPTISRRFSSFGSVNITECAQKLREEMEDDPEEEVESAPEPGFVCVHELRVKIEYAPLVEAIFERYGDITDASDNKSSAILSLLLEHVCVICNQLKGTNFSDVTRIELEKMLAEVGDLERQKLNVGWLRQKIEHIIRAKVDFGRYLDVKEKKIEHDKRIERIEEELRDEKVKNDEAEKLALDIKTRVVYHKTHSLLHGLF